MTKLLQTKLPYISVCDANLPQGLSEKISDQKPVANKKLK